MKVAPLRVLDLRFGQQYFSQLEYGYFDMELVVSGTFKDACPSTLFSRLLEFDDMELIFNGTFKEAGFNDASPCPSLPLQVGVEYNDK